MNLRMAIAASALLVGCLPERTPPGDRGYFAGPRRERPATPVTDAPTPPAPSPWTPPVLPRTPPTGGEAPPPVFDPTPPLPAPWPADVFDVVAPRLARMVVASEDAVGLAPQPDGLLVVERRGGLFRADAFGRLLPEVTPLPDPVTRTFALGDVLVACTPPAEEARFSVDGGRSWASLDLQCGQAGHRTVAGRGPLTFALAGEHLRVGPLPRGRARYVPAPVEAPEALGALDAQVVVFGAHEVARSEDAGAHFEIRPRPTALAEVRDVLFAGKGTVLAAGRAALDRPAGSALLVSTDAGRSWRPVPLPRRLDTIAALALRGDGAILAVPEDASDGAVVSLDGGRTFEALPPGVLLAGAAEGVGPALVAGSPRGLIQQLDGAGPVLGLDQPLHAVAFTHPQVAVGIGQGGGLYRSRDGGRTWHGEPAWAGIPFGDVASVGGHTVMVVGDGVLWRSEDAGERFDPRPLPSSCRARWVRFSAAGDGLVGCRDGGLLASDDAGRTWTEAPAPPAALRPVVFLADGTRLALTETGRLATDAGDGWRLDDAPVAAPLELRPLRGGASLLGADGAVAVRPADRAAWQALHRQGGGLRGVRAHQVLADDAVLLLDAEGLVVQTADAPPRRLATTRGADAFQLTGDGGALILQDTATTLFLPR
ncbi:MAG: hypothetical protein H6706_10220 [Myxococcales bacterium]|nr:hypothetical protein [Myxococcales bacterium]